MTSTTAAGGHQLVAAIGSQPDVVGFALAGVVVLPAETPEAAQAAWESLPEGVSVVVLTADAATAIGTARTAEAAPLSVVLPP
ncbi:MAG TPA: V-type ATP synthase subunit F [Actinomycetes bacterium]|nr:V-type ATP synthase subunit F [Actinomycetes bacterium]